jgi:hypothetical protein
MIKREIEVRPTVPELAKEFAGLSADDQVSFFIEVRKRFDSWQPHARDLQFAWIGDQMRASGHFVCDFINRLAGETVPPNESNTPDAKGTEP